MRALLLDLLETAVDKCYADDKTLIDRSMERASVSRIYYYMQEMIKNEDKFTSLREHNLDSEYNKNGQEIKGSSRFLKGMIPDIILHKRGHNCDNLLVVEFKSHNGKNEKYPPTGQLKDIVKLEDFTNEKYSYFLGVFVKLYKKEPKYRFFQYGNEIDAIPENSPRYSLGLRR